MAMLAVNQKGGPGDAWQLGETDLFMIFDGQRAQIAEVTAAFVDTRSKAAQEEDAEPGVGSSKGKPAKRAKRSARTHAETRPLLHRGDLRSTQTAPESALHEHQSAGDSVLCHFLA